MIDQTALITSTMPAVEPTRGDDPAKAASQVFARLLVAEVQKAMPEGGLLGGSNFAPLEAIVTEALASKLAEGDNLGLAKTFEGLASPSESAPFTPRPGLVDGGVVSSAFGERVHPIHGQLHHHDGIDIAAPEGSEIRASRRGVVVFAGSAKGYGNLVVVDHGEGLQTRYAHCDTLTVKQGTHVRAGDAIATVGNTGNSTGPHLHFEVRQDGKAIDPWPFTGDAKGTADPTDTHREFPRKLRLP